MSKPLIYLDHAAATPLDPGVLRAMQPYLTDNFYNPSATYLPGVVARQALEVVRATVAGLLGSRPAEIIFTAGGTEANNLAIQGVLRQYPDTNVVVSSIEHESVLAPAHDYDCRVVKVQADGRLDLADLRQRVDPQTVLVSIGYANNEIGTIQSLKEIAKIVAEQRAARGADGLPLYFHTDACQAGNYLDLHVSRLGVDLMTLNGGKVYGPKQSGVLYVKAGTLLKPLILGGGQERGLRSGTENLAAAVGFSTALELAQNQRQTEGHRLQALQQQFINLVKKQIPSAEINGSLKQRLANNLHLTLPGKDNERLLVQLEQASILAAAGSACIASNEEPSHVLRAIGLSDQAAQASLRLTMGRETTEAMINQTVAKLSEL